MELSRFRLWVFWFSAPFKELPLKNKNIQNNLSVESKINLPKAGCKFSNKRKSAHSYRENPPKKQTPSGDISELSFKVKFPLPNTPSPKGGGLRGRNFTILMGKTLQKEGLLKFWLMESPKLKAKYPQILNFVSQCFLLCKPRLSVLKERRKSSDKPVLIRLKASGTMLKGRRKVCR